MLDPKLLRNDLDSVVAQLARKGVTFDVAAYQALETKRKSLQLETESLQNRRKDGSKSVGLLMKDGKRGEAEQLKAEIAGIGDELAAIESQFNDVLVELDRILMETPNLPDVSVPRREQVKTRTLRSPSLAESQSLDSLSGTTLRSVNCSRALISIARRSSLAVALSPSMGRLLGYTVR